MRLGDLARQERVGCRDAIDVLDRLQSGDIGGVRKRERERDQRWIAFEVGEQMPDERS